MDAGAAGGEEARVIALCWSVVTNSGRVSKACHSSLDAGESTTGVCVACGSKNEGVRPILLDKYEAK